MTDNWEALAEAVKAARADLGLTQEEVAAAGGPSSATMRLIEGAMQTSYRPRTFAALERGLGWPKGKTRRVLRGEEEPPKAPEPLVLEWRLPPEAAELSFKDREYVEGLIRHLAALRAGG